MKRKVMSNPPRCFISYSHDNDPHKEWVLDLATRLMSNGVDVILDQWDLYLGSDLPSFMEGGLSGADRVIAICSENYVTKANQGVGGVGYEKMILTADLMKNINSNRVIPLIRNNESEKTTPTFLSTKLYLSFKNDSDFEKSYTDLIKEIHGVTVKARPPMGSNPFAKTESPIAADIALKRTQYISSALEGRVNFNFDNNDNTYHIGAGEALFDVRFSGADNSSIYVYKDPSNIEGIALFEGSNFSEVGDASKLDYTSRTRTPHVGQIVSLVNTNGYFALIKIESVQTRSHGAAESVVEFLYKINEMKQSRFS